MSPKPLVELWACFWEDALFLCRHDTGVVYTNQVGGTCCSHPTIEGFLVPIRVQDQPREALIDSVHDECCWEKLGRNIDWDMVKVRTKEALIACGLNVVFEPLSDSNQEAFLACVNSNRFGSDRVYFAEAWLPVQVRADIDEPTGYGSSTPYKCPNDTALLHLGGRWGVLTWKNSD